MSASTTGKDNLNNSPDFALSALPDSSENDAVKSESSKRELRGGQNYSLVTPVKKKRVAQKKHIALKQIKMTMPPASKVTPLEKDDVENAAKMQLQMLQQMHVFMLDLAKQQTQSQQQLQTLVLDMARQQTQSQQQVEKQVHQQMLQQQQAQQAMQTQMQQFMMQMQQNPQRVSADGGLERPVNVMGRAALPEFDGSGDPDNHIEIYECIAATERWTLDQIQMYFYRTLRKTAEMWYTRNGIELNGGTWEQLKEKFLAQFRSINFAVEYQAAAIARCQGENESAYAYMEDKARLWKRVQPDISVTLLLGHIRPGLGLHIRERMTGQKPKTEGAFM